MKIYTYTLLVYLLFAGAVHAQTTCPLDRVCLTIEQARQALIDADTVKAQKTELVVKTQSLNDQEKVITDLKIELAKMTGDKTGAEQMVVRLTAIIDFMLKNGRTKKYGVLVF